jgi:hypothetical protein
MVKYSHVSLLHRLFRQWEQRTKGEDNNSLIKLNSVWGYFQFEEHDIPLFLYAASIINKNYSLYHTKAYYYF